MSARKRKAPTQATTINNFFHTQTVNVHAPAPAEETPGRWLPPPPPRDSRVSQTLGGALRIQCTQCKGSKKATCTHGPEQFIPNVYHPRAAATYGKALERLGEARIAKDSGAFLDARTTIATLATMKCVSCRAKIAKSEDNPATLKGACRAEWARLKAEIFHTCGQCGATRAIEANHKLIYADNAKAHAVMAATHGKEEADATFPASDRKLMKLSATDSYWHFNGGPTAMREEATKCEPLCSMCHALDESSNMAPQNAGSREKAEAKEYATALQRNTAVRCAEAREEKRAYVNSLKRRIKTCENPSCLRDGPSNGLCTRGFETCYDWDHIDATAKEYAIVEIVRDSSSFATAKPKILAELGFPPNFDVEKDPIPPIAERRCRLLCRNCHHTRSDWDVSS